MSNNLSSQLNQASSFFLPKRASLAATDGQGAQNVPSMFQPGPGTTGGVMQFNGQLPDSVSDAERALFATLLKDQQFYLQSGLGLVTAWMTDQYQREPTKWADPTCWQDPLSALPAEFYTPTDITEYHFQQHMKGVEVASSFLETMIGWASGAGIVASFGSFLSTLGNQIKAGVTSKNTAMNTYNLTFSYQPIQDTTGAWQLISQAEYYFISFTESEKTIYSSCASAETFDFDFKYQKGSLLLNWASMSSDVNKAAKSQWDGAIGQASVDDVTKAKNFFGGKVKPN